jgi:putative transposase
VAKATKTIQQALSHQPQFAVWFEENQRLYNRVVAFYVEVIQAHVQVLELPNKEALTALETLTHATADHPRPVMPLTEVEANIPAMLRRAAINAALGSARAFFSTLKKWQTKKAKAEAKGKNFHERPPVPPRTYQKSVPFYAGMYKARHAGTIVLKVWTGACWSWVKVHTLGCSVENGFELGSPVLVCKGGVWWLHTPIEKTFTAPAKVAAQVTDTTTKLCSVDLNLGENVAVCTVQTVEGTILATKFIKGGKRVNGFRKKQLGRIARNRSKTGVIAEGEQDNVNVWASIRNADESRAHLVSARIVQFAREHGASILVFEHLGTLKPEKGRYSTRANSKRAYWMKGRIFTYAKYKAWSEGIITSRVNPRNTSRECARCHQPIIRYAQGMSEQGYTIGTPLMVCPTCGKRDNADRNASIVIGQRLIARSQEKPPTPREETKVSGVVLCHDAEGETSPSPMFTGRHAEHHGHGTAQRGLRMMDAPTRSIPPQLRLFTESSL